MPHLYFHVVARGEMIADREGGEYPHAEAALTEARSSAREIWADGIRNGEDRSGWLIRIADGSGHVVAEISFAATLLEG